VEVNRHIFGKFEQDEEDIAFFFWEKELNGDYKVVETHRKRKDLKAIGCDTLITKGAQGFAKVKSLRASYAKVNDVITLIAYKSKEDFLNKKYAMSSVPLQKMLPSDLPGGIKAGKGEMDGYATGSSVNGNCGAPWLNTEGKAIGWHAATSGEQCIFVVITPQMAALADKSF
jgi:hypothetical protein